MPWKPAIKQKFLCMVIMQRNFFVVSDYFSSSGSAKSVFSTPV